MSLATVVGLPRSSASSVAQSLAGILRAPLQVDPPLPARDNAVTLVTSAEAIDPSTPLLVFTDDAPLNRGQRPEEATAILGAAARALRHGAAVAILPSGRSTKRWLAKVEDEGLPITGLPVRRIFLAAHSSPASYDLANRLAAGLGLLLLEPDLPGHEPAPEGWGPRYAAAAAGDSWVIRSASWHAVEALAVRADLIIHPQLEDKFAAEDDAPVPAAKRWRFLFAPWWQRYPRTESRLLSKGLAAHAHEAPVFTILTEQEFELVVSGLLALSPVPTS